MISRIHDMKHIKDSERYSILTDDLTHCIICGRGNVNLHEIFSGRNRQNSKDYGLVIPLCQELHHNQVECKGIHFEPELRDYWHKVGQKAFEEKYDEDFLSIFRRNYLE